MSVWMVVSEDGNIGIKPKYYRAQLLRTPPIIITSDMFWLQKPSLG
jgi:hypothetical protein